MTQSFFSPYSYPFVVIDSSVAPSVPTYCKIKLPNTLFPGTGYLLIRPHIDVFHTCVRDDKDILEPDSPLALNALPGLQGKDLALLDLLREFDGAGSPEVGDLILAQPDAMAKGIGPTVILVVVAPLCGFRPYFNHIGG